MKKLGSFFSRRKSPEKNFLKIKDIGIKKHSPPKEREELNLPILSKVNLSIKLEEPEQPVRQTRRRYISDIPKVSELSYEYLKPKSQKYTQYLRKAISKKHRVSNSVRGPLRYNISPSNSLVNNSIVSKYLIDIA